MASSWRKQFDPNSSEPFTISRSKIDLYTECPRCAYLDLRLGVKRVSGPAFTLNNAVDELFKREFDIHRAYGTKHSLMEAYGIDAVPFNDDRLEEWRDALRRGVTTHHEETNFIIRGGIDDVWRTPTGELIVVDYKATAKKQAPTTPEDLYPSFKKQIEMYQWLFRQNGFQVSPTGYFVYANGQTDRKAFDAKLEFEVNLIPYRGDDSWIEPMLRELKATLMSEDIPAVGVNFSGDAPCDYCTYREDAGKILQKVHAQNKK
ncbi:PD-(D/E)XK nuclease family protein [Candidatus Parcubacteria bacterium]|nr:PD-(D/E)XK nuclease family protein [Candidatus Parcubacteria bacterium]